MLGFGLIEGLSLAFAPSGLGKVWGEIRNCAWKKGATDDPVRQCHPGKSVISRSVTDNWTFFNSVGICILGEYKASTFRDPFPLSLLKIPFLQATPDR